MMHAHHPPPRQPGMQPGNEAVELARALTMVYSMYADSGRLGPSDCTGRSRGRKAREATVGAQPLAAIGGGAAPQTSLPH